jgi:PilZ domain-containing protein
MEHRRPFPKQERRRSQRVPQSVPLLVKCLDPPFTFGGNLNTVEVSSHGCVIHALRPFPHGTRLRLDILHGHRTTTARVVHSDPIGTGMRLRAWTVALELDKPGNVWMVKPPPPDWPKTSEQQRNREHPPSGSNRVPSKESRS